MTNDMAQDHGRRMRPGAVAAGGVLLALGVLLLLDTTGTVRIQVWSTDGADGVDLDGGDNPARRRLLPE